MYLFSKHQRDNLQHMHGEIPLIFWTGNVEEKVFQTAAVYSPGK